MLGKYYNCQRTIWRLSHCGAFGEKMDGYISYLEKRQLSTATIREYIRAAAHLSRFALWQGICDLAEFDEPFVCRFVNEHLPNCSCERVNRGKYNSAVQGAWHVLQYLGEVGIIPACARLTLYGIEPKAYTIQKLKSAQEARVAPRVAKYNAASGSACQYPPRTDASSQEIILENLPENMGDVLQHYDEYLTRLFGLCKKTRDMHRAKALLFMKWVYDKHGHIFQLSALNADDVIDYQKTCNAYGFSNDYKKTLTSCLRGFLRFLRWQRILEKDLCPAVYRVKDWAMASTPKFIPYEAAEQLLSVPDRNTSIGKRDYLALLLMLRLGLRACEVIKLELSDISLAKGQILIRGTKNSKDHVLPLNNEITEAIVSYLQTRPHEVNCEHLFLRSVPPFRKLTSPAVFGGVVRHSIKALGIATPSFGTHLLRHTLATHMINNGATLKETADILNHSSIDTTFIYAKVQIERLRRIVMPFPGYEEVLP